MDITGGEFLGFDPTVSQTAAKSYLKAHSINPGRHDPTSVVLKHKTLVQSLNWKPTDDISYSDWKLLNDASRMQFLRKYMPG